MGLFIPHHTITQCQSCVADKVLLTSFWIKTTEVSIWLSAMGISELCQMSSVAVFVVQGVGAIASLGHIVYLGSTLVSVSMFIF